MNTTHNVLRLRVGPYILINTAVARGVYHSHRWALPGGGSLTTVELHGLARLRGWSAPQDLDDEPLSLAQVAKPAGVPDAVVGRINRVVTKRDVWPGVTR